MVFHPVLQQGCQQHCLQASLPRVRVLNRHRSHLPSPLVSPPLVLATHRRHSHLHSHLGYRRIVLLLYLLDTHLTIRLRLLHLRRRFYQVGCQVLLLLQYPQATRLQSRVHLQLVAHPVFQQGLLRGNLQVFLVLCLVSCPRASRLLGLQGNRQGNQAVFRRVIQAPYRHLHRHRSRRTALQLLPLILLIFKFFVILLLHSRTRKRSSASDGSARSPMSQIVRELAPGQM